MNMILALIESMRPKQWTKNLLLFAGLLFSNSLFDTGLLLKALAGFVLFCLLSGGQYMLNDLLDLEKDKKLPVKSLRPLA